MNKASERNVAYRPAERRMVSLPLDEIQAIRDKLMRLRDAHPHIRLLFSQVAALYQRLAAADQANAQPRTNVLQRSET